ncbi:MAG TPA: beta-propeller domain-containing protein [Polyangiaceae bacterium]|nr:beta-propeller domain-containing protein [Polyangiaceae bacterium]
MDPTEPSQPMQPTEPMGSGDAPVAGEDEIEGDGASDFESSAPSGGGGGDGISAAGTFSGGGRGAAPEAGDAPDDAERAISEADILQLSGDRLYALSRFSGLSVIDASTPGALRLEGVYRSAAEPFEMYVEDGLVYAMFNGWLAYGCDATGFCGWQSESRVQALDTRDPANIALLADLEVPGTIADSRRVGDVMYLATEQSGGCWGCEAESNTTLTSFDLSTPGQFAQIDQLRLPSVGAFGGTRSISVTNERVYIGGYDYDENFNLLPGSVQVVDISDAAGALVAGAVFDVAGPIQSRWQMDEFDGVFRVISQPGGWGAQLPPVLETFEVLSSDDVARVGYLTVSLPRENEVLQSARFDGTRGYAITAEQVDPLLTFDLSDPLEPVQLGELTMPGWVYHLEPRGDRLFALGYDPANPDGALNVSLFDVSDLEQPVLLSRAAFGGDFGSFAEGQNQIHKAFSILPDEGLILVPFSGGTTDELTCEYEYGSGIQLLDFDDTTLTARGVAPQVGDARRALLHREHLIGIGDNAVQAFDISDRDAPLQTGQLDVARNVTTVRVLGDHLLRFGSDWATNQTILDMTPVAQASTAEPQAEIDLSALFGEDAWTCNGSVSWAGQVFTRGDHAYVPRYKNEFDPETGESEQRLKFYVVDISDRNAPRAVGSFAVEPARGETHLTGILQTENTLLVGRSQGEYIYDPIAGAVVGAPRFFYDVIELGNPSAPTVASRFEMPADIAGNGWGVFGVGGCSVDRGWGWYGGSGGELTDGDMVISQHAAPVAGKPGALKYYLDRLDVSDPRQPKLLPPINIPGTPVHYDDAASVLVTIDYQESIEEATSPEECATRGYSGYQDEAGACRVTRRSINALQLQPDRATRTGYLPLDVKRRTGNIAVSDNRIFYTTTGFPPVFDGGGVIGTGGPVLEGALPGDAVPAEEAPAREAAPAGDALPGAEGAAPPVELSAVMLETLRLDAGKLSRLPARELRRLPNDGYYYAELFARDERLFEIFDQTVTVVDTLAPEATQSISRDLPGWGCSSLEVSENAAYCAVGQRGVEVIDLSSMRPAAGTLD